MRVPVVRLLATYPPQPPRSQVVAIGTFDGVHRGHQGVLDKARALGRKLGLPVAVLTFDRHPLVTLRGEPPPLITPFPERVRLLAARADTVVVAVFDRSFARMEAVAFLEQVVVGRLGAAAVVVGENFTFGQGGAGDVALLRREGARAGLEVEVAEPVLAGGEPVSSSRVRRAVAAGRVEEARELLGRPFTVEGPVVAGAGRGGRLLGYPTANVATPAEQILPAAGVYLGAARLHGRRRAALVVVGGAPTFGDAPAGRGVEAFLLGCAGSLRGERLALEFLERVRGLVRFASPAALAEQIRADVAWAHERLHAHGLVLE